MTAICDASTLIALARIDQLSLLERLYGQVIIPESVFREVLKESKPGAEEIKKATYIKVEKVQDRTVVQMLLANLGEGEAEVLILAKEKRADVVLIDEKKARKMARKAEFKVMGVLGLFISAKEAGYIFTIKPLIEKLNKQGFRMSDKVIQRILKEAGEY